MRDVACDATTGLGERTRYLHGFGQWVEGQRIEGVLTVPSHRSLRLVRRNTPVMCRRPSLAAGSPVSSAGAAGGLRALRQCRRSRPGLMLEGSLLDGGAYAVREL